MLRGQFTILRRLETFATILTGHCMNLRGNHTHINRAISAMKKPPHHNGKGAYPHSLQFVRITPFILQQVANIVHLARCHVCKQIPERTQKRDIFIQFFINRLNHFALAQKMK